MLVEKRLHHVVRGHRRMGHGLAGDGGPACQAESEDFVGRRKRRREGDLYLVPVCGNPSAAQGQADGGVAQLQPDFAGKPVVPEGEHGDGDARAGADIVRLDGTTRSSKPGRGALTRNR